MNTVQDTKIKITKTPKSRLEFTDFNDLAFGEIKSDHMFVAQYRNGEWTNLEIKPYDYLQLSPACISIHYGQSIFEGMKAFRTDDGGVNLFRPEKNMKRLQQSAERMAMVPVPDDVFMEGLMQLLELDQDWVPQGADKSLYIRPYQFADEPNIGVRESDSYTFLIFTCPTGKYYSKDVNVYIEEDYIRAARGGAGFAKAAGNYAPTLLPTRLVREKGYDQILWTQILDGTRYVQEIGTMNFFVQIDDTIITAPLDGTILEGITRDSIIQIAKDEGIPLEEKLLSVDELVSAAKEGRVHDAFGAGTAAVITHIAGIGYRDELIELPPVSDRKYGPFFKDRLVAIQRGQYEDKHNWVKKI